MRRRRNSTDDEIRALERAAKAGDERAQERLAARRTRLGQKQSAWDSLLPEHRSEHVGWSKSGEFYCPHCSVIIGKNLRDEKPFLLASRHLEEHRVRRTNPGQDDEIRALERKELEGPLSIVDRKRLDVLKARATGVSPITLPWGEVPDEEAFQTQAEAWAKREIAEGKRKPTDPPLIYGVDLTREHDDAIFDLIQEQAGFGSTTVEGGVAEREIPSGVTKRRSFDRPELKNVVFWTYPDWESVLQQIRHLVEVAEGEIEIDDGTGEMSISTDEGVWYTGETEQGGFTIPPGVVSISWLQPPATAEEGEVPTSDSVQVEDELEELRDKLESDSELDDVRAAIEARIEQLEDLKNAVSDYVEGSEIREIQAERGWGAHLTHRGYMDQTTWHAVYATEREALEEMAQFEDVMLPDEVEARRNRAYEIAREFMASAGFVWENEDQ